MTRYAIGIGSNLESRIGHLRAAVDGMAALGSVEAISPLYESAPVGGPEQGPYLNAVALLDTPLSPGELLAGLHRIEAGEGRERSVRWGPRTLDLDIVAAETAHESPDLTIPHPRAVEREFVLRPLADVWPGAIVAHGVSARAALPLAGDQGVDEVGRRAWLGTERGHLGRALVTIQLAWFAGIAVVMARDGTLPQGDASWSRFLGLAAAVLGGALAFVSSRRLGGALTARPEPKSGSELVVVGPYALARHPIYGGVILFMTGTALIVDSAWGVAASLGLIPFFWIKAGYEERLLRAAFQSYREYRLRVRRRLIPFLL